MNGSVALKQAKKYTEESLNGAGALKGAPCTIKSTQTVDDGTRVVFEWTDNSGNIQTSSIFVKNGITITSVTINTAGHLICSTSDGNTIDAGEIRSNIARSDIEEILGISIMELQSLVTIISDSEVRIDKTLSSSKISTELANILNESKSYTLAEIGNAIGASYKVVSSTADMTDTKYIYLLPNAGTYDMYIYDGATNLAVKIGNTTISLDNIYTKGEVDSGFVLKTVFNLLTNDVGDVTNLNTVSRTLVSAVNEVNTIVDTHITDNNIHVTLSDKLDFHNHANKSVLDTITQTDINNWNSGTGGSGTAGKSAYEIAVDNGFVGSETEWLASLKGQDGSTPTIGSNNNWFIDNVDTGVSAVGKDGRSITGITTDDNNNVFVTFSDNTTQNIGKLSVDVQADFLSSDGFGKLRYYNSHFQYYDESTSTWVDTSVTPDNVYVMNITPQPMKSISCKFDCKLNKLKLKFKESADTVIDGQVFCIVEKVIIRRKLGSAPIDENDGDLVVEVLRNSFGTYSEEWFTDEGVTPNIDDTYYYKAFPMSTTGFYGYSDLNAASVTCKEYTLYGFKIDQNESDPASMITYLPDCENAQYASAYMDYSTDTFNYGDWVDAWFIKDLKPCMLKYDGTVDYELDRNDYTKKADGTDSDVANTAYEGNAMIGFPKVYWKIVNNGDDTANVYISDVQVDDGYRCWSHIDNNGNEIDYCYMPIYDGSLIDNKLRSISNITPCGSYNRISEINYAKANNIDENIIWYTEVYSDRLLLRLLLTLIGKSTASQDVFGMGNCSSNTIVNTGTLNQKGMFWGNVDGSKCVKIFGMENVWGNRTRGIAGLVYDYTTASQKVKMTYGQNDGSTVDGYNTDGNGYINIPSSTLNYSASGYISKMIINDNGLFPAQLSGSDSTYYTDITWIQPKSTYAMMGGATMHGNSTGIFAIGYYFDTTTMDPNTAASISCKPLAPTT
jgi:hypothetical protein